MTNRKNSIANRLKIARQHGNFSQEEIAEKLNVNQRTISNWENSISEPSIDNLTKLTQILNADVEYLIGIDTLTQKLFDLTNKVTWLNYFLSNSTEKNIVECCVSIEQFELTEGNRERFKALSDKEKTVFFVKNSMHDLKLKNEIIVDKELLSIPNELLPYNWQEESPNYKELVERIINFYPNVKPYQGILNFI